MRFTISSKRQVLLKIECLESNDGALHVLTKHVLEMVALFAGFVGPEDSDEWFSAPQDSTAWELVPVGLEDEKLQAIMKPGSRLKVCGPDAEIVLDID